MQQQKQKNPQHNVGNQLYVGKCLPYIDPMALSIFSVSGVCRGPSHSVSGTLSPSHRWFRAATPGGRSSLEELCSQGGLVRANRRLYYMICINKKYILICMQK